MPRDEEQTRQAGRVYVRWGGEGRKRKAKPGAYLDYSCWAAAHAEAGVREKGNNENQGLVPVEPLGVVVDLRVSGILREQTVGTVVSTIHCEAPHDVAIVGRHG